MEKSRRIQNQAWQQSENNTKDFLSTQLNN